ncbi:hypothetical protein HUJ05_000303 [Dendroctonus ponderosae]|nr:hypothetical protein HUJ05_000303 [Dendroctonus ponderosae]
MLNRRRRKILLASRENSKQSTYYYKQLVKIAESLIIQHNRACLENGQQYVAAKSQLTNNNSDQSLSKPIAEKLIRKYHQQ